MNLKNTGKICIVVSILLFILLWIGFLFIYPKYATTVHLRKRTELSQQLIKKIDDIANRNTNIEAIQVVDVNLAKNTRHIVYISIKQPVVNKLYLEFLANSITIYVPIFTNNDRQNAVIVRLIHREFVCSTIKDSMSYALVPEIIKYVSTICMVTVPPSQGDITGMIAVFLKNTPTDIEKDILRADMKLLAKDIYIDLN